VRVRPRTCVLTSRLAPLLAVLLIAATAHASTGSSGYLLVCNQGSGTVGLYRTDGTPVNPKPHHRAKPARGRRSLWDDLYVSSFGNPLIGGGMVGKYTTVGAVVNANLITGLTQPASIAVSGDRSFRRPGRRQRHWQIQHFGRDDQPVIYLRHQSDRAVRLGCPAFMRFTSPTPNITSASGHGQRRGGQRLQRPPASARVMEPLSLALIFSPLRASLRWIGPGEEVRRYLRRPH